MSFALIAYPKISISDNTLIETYREKHDKLFSVIKPHITLVFPIDGITAEEFVNAITSNLANEKQIAFIMRCAVLNKDAFRPVYHAFLVFDEGNSGLIKLHDLAYKTPAINKFHHMEIDYIPHITVASSADINQIKGIISEFNSSNFEIAGKIQSVDLIEITDFQVKTLKKISLKVN